MNKNITLLILTIFLIQIACTSQKGIRFAKRRIAPTASIAIIVDSPNNVKNVILGKFLTRGFRVKAINASDLYTIDEVYDIRDLKRLSYKIRPSSNVVAFEKTYNNMYKLHIYNFELNKAEFLAEIKAKFNIRYLLLLDLKDWKNVSWGRIIDLDTYEIVWLDNYPTKYTDDLDTVLNHFIASITRR